MEYLSLSLPVFRYELRISAILDFISSCCFIRFLMLCTHSKYNSLKQLALDTLGNMALKVRLLDCFPYPDIYCNPLSDDAALLQQQNHADYAADNL